MRSLANFTNEKFGAPLSEGFDPERSKHDKKVHDRE